jgi:hypothetical protein
MLLPGRLGATTLGDLLGTLYRARATGVLELVELDGAVAGRTHRIHLERGLVAHVDSPLRVPRLGEILQGGGFLAASAACRLEGRATSCRKSIGTILLEEGLCTPQVLGAALRHQLRSRLDALFGLADARLGFHVACPRGTRHDSPVPLSPHETLHGRPRQREPLAARKGCRADSARARAFAVLGLEAGADRARVQRAFRQRAAEVHPDRHPRASATERAALLRRFSELSAAYHELVA